MYIRRTSATSVQFYTTFSLIVQEKNGNVCLISPNLQQKVNPQIITTKKIIESTTLYFLTQDSSILVEWRPTLC